MSVGQIAQVGLGAAGFFLGGTTGAAVGWLVGGWLFSDSSNEGNDIIDPGAQELPGINQALRGVTIPVLFGTNRCESFHTWRKNFTPIRSEGKDETGAGGKMGGSGGGGKAGQSGGGGSVSYTYTLDAMYQIGLTDGDYFMYGGWMETERLNDQTIGAISQGLEGSGGVLFGANADVPKEASLEFTEAYYYPGGDTAPGWTYFHQQENINVTDAASLGMRWTHMAWVGFRGLNLGDSPATPGLQWEIGPGSGTIDLENVDYGSSDRGTVLENGFSNQMTKNGRWFSAASTTLHKLMYVNDDGTVTQWTTTGGGFIQTCLIDAGIDHGGGYFLGESCMIIPGTDLALMLGHNDDGGTQNQHGFVLVDLSSHDGSLSTPFIQANCIGAVHIRGKGLEFKHKVTIGIGRTGLQVDTSKILVVFQQMLNDDHWLLVLPTIAQFKAKNVDEVASGSFGLRATELPAEIGAKFPGTAAGRHVSINSSIFWFLPAISGSDFGTNMYVYISRDLADTSNNAYIIANRDANPDGWVISLNIGQTDVTVLDKPIFAALVERNSDFINSSGAVSMPPTDESTGVDGSPSTNGQYRPEVTVQKWEGVEVAGAYLVLMHKMYYGSVEAAPFGTLARVVVWLYNPISGKFTLIGRPQAPIFDTVVDAGMAEGDRFIWFAPMSAVTYSEKTKSVRYIGNWDSTSPPDPLENEYVTADFGTLDIGGATDVTPPFIIRQILTNAIYGMGTDDADIDAVSFGLAVQYCEAEQILVSTKYRREKGYLQILDLLLSLYNGYLFRRGKTIHFGLMDFGQESGAEPVRVLDNDHFVVEEGRPPIEVTEGAAQDTFNRIKVNYLDRALEYRQNYVEVNDEVDQDFRGIRAKEFPAQFVMSEKLAQKIAIRGLWGNLYARDTYQWFIGWKDSDLEPGDLITLVDSFDTKLSGGIRTRIVTIEEMEPGKWKCNGTQELEHVVTAQPLVNSSTNNSSGGFRRGATGAAALFNMYELPREFQGANPVLYTGWAQGERSAGAKLWVSGDNTTFSIAADITPHTISGIFAEGLPARPRGWVERDVTVYLFPDVRSAAFNPASPAFTESFILEDGGETQRALGGTALWVGSEMVAYQGPTLVASNQYRFDRVYRGWGGTPIQDHSSGDFWWRHGGGVFTQTYNEDKIGTKIFYKVTPYNFSGFTWPVESVDAQEYTIEGTYFRPQNPGNVHIWVDSVDFTQTTQRGLTSITSLNLKAEWEDSARQEGFGALGYGKLGYGHFQTDPLSHSWRVEVVGSGGTIVHSVVVTTPFFVYSAGQNLADNGAFRPNVAFKVTPFSNFGDSLVTETVSLDFFGV